ncbi:MAG: phosphohistidine phosphatase SixA [Burkholderiales bacterium]
MRVYLVQHGEAHAEEVSPERELTPRGRSDVERIAALLANGGVRVAKVCHSGKTRARQTAELLAARLAPGVTSEALAGINPNDPVESLADRLRGWSEDALVAGHQPFMGKLVALLIAGRSEPPVVAYQQGSVVCLERNAEGRWVLVWMVRPEFVARGLLA